MADIEDWARDRPMFTLNEAERALGMQRASLRQKLSRMTRRGDLHRIERGKYSAYDDPMVYATYLETPAYLTLWSALRYYDLTTQQPTRVQVMAATARTDLDDIEFYHSTELFGFGRQPYDTVEIFVAHEERLLLDCLSRPEVSVRDVIDLVEAIDPSKVIEYAERFDRYATQKRVGYLLERLRGVTVERLQVSDRNYPRLDLSAPATGPTNARWRLRVNTDVG